MNLTYESLVTGREESLFEDDLQNHSACLRERIRNRRILIIGAAGSIGSSVVRTLLPFEPRALALVDLSENNLVELVRNLRSDTIGLPAEFDTLPIGLGSEEFARYINETEPFDYLFNLSAIKHVRSEKNIYCLMRMLNTNILYLSDLLATVPYRFQKVFSVSSDKATNPANLMGASKMVMEKVLLANSDQQPFSSARFANVAFSDGSLPHGFLERISQKQPLSAPNDVKRYFISHREAGQLCVLSAITGNNRDVLFPKFKEQLDEKTFADIACDLLHAQGYEPFVCGSEEEAKRRVPELLPQKKWPCYFFASDTSGEKGYEEFHTESEKLDLDRYLKIGVICRDTLAETDKLNEFLAFCRSARNDISVTKDDYVRAMQEIVPTLHHVETGKNLDQKM